MEATGFTVPRPARQNRPRPASENLRVLVPQQSAEPSPSSVKKFSLGAVTTPPGGSLSPSSLSSEADSFSVPVASSPVASPGPAAASQPPPVTRSPAAVAAEVNPLSPFYFSFTRYIACAALFYVVLYFYGSGLTIITKLVCSPHDQSIDIPFSIWPGSAAPKNVSFSMLKEPGGFCDLLAPWKDIPDVLVHNDGEPGYAGTLVELLNDSDHALRDLSIYVRNSRLEERDDIQMALKNIIDAGEAAKRLNNNFNSRLAPLIPHLPPKSKRLIRQLASSPPPGLHDRLFSHILDPLFLLRNDPLKLFLVPKPSNLTAWEIPKLVSVMHELNTTLTTMQTEHRRIEDVLVLLGMSMEPGRNVYVRGVLARFWMRLATETDCRNRHFRTHVKLLSGYEVHLRWAVKAAGDALRVVREVEASLGQQERKGKSCSVLEEARRISCMKGAEIYDEVGRAVGESWVFGETL